MSVNWENLRKDVRYFLIIVQCNLGDHAKENEKAGHAVGVTEIIWMWRHEKEQDCSVSNSSVVYSEVSRFEGRLGFDYFEWRFSCFPLARPGKCKDSTFNLRHILPYPFQFNIHYNPVAHHIIWITDRAIK